MQVDKICRACLCEDDKMVNMPEKDIYQKFLLFANLTAEEIPNISLNLCQCCEQKLNFSLDFKEECQKSHEILSNYVKNTCEVKSEATHNDTSNVDSESSAADADVKKPSRIEKFSQSQVSEAINDVKQTFYRIKNCIRCSYVGNNLRALAQHISRSHKDLKPRWCCVCNREFDNLTDHVALNHSNDNICKFCRKKFQSVSCLIRHLHNYTDVKKYHCSFCEKRYTKKTDLYQHLKKHVKEGICGAQLAALELKERKRLRTNKAPHKCTDCNKIFKSRDHLVRHKRTHTGEKPHCCQVCEKSFSQFGNLKRHMMLHNIGTKISCTICDKSFKRMYLLHIHLRTHTGENPYVCTECGKGFVSSSYLVQHSKSHSDLRPYQCNKCDKSFKLKSGLLTHMLTHSGEKPYKCNQCSYACITGHSLTLHMKKHEVDKPQEDRPHVCLMCNRTFTTDAVLTSHIHTHKVSFLEI